MSGYKIPDFSQSLSECEYDRLRKYCINAASFLLDKYLYSKKGVENFFTFKKRIPSSVKVDYGNNDVRNVDIVSSVIKELEELKLINDKRNVSFHAESLLLFRKKSVSATKTNLWQKGFSDDDIEDAVADIVNSKDYDEQRSLVNEADKIVRRSSFKNKDVRKRKHMFISSLVSKGFSLTDIAELLDKGDYRPLFEDE